jgi:hypothetical protein
VVVGDRLLPFSPEERPVMMTDYVNEMKLNMSQMKK